MFLISSTPHFALHALWNTKEHILPRTIHLSYQCAFANAVPFSPMFFLHNPPVNSYPPIKTLPKHNLLKEDFCIPRPFLPPMQFINSSLVLSLHHVQAYIFVTSRACRVLSSWSVGCLAWLTYLFPSPEGHSCRQELCLNPPLGPPCPIQHLTQNEHLIELNGKLKMKTNIMEN